MHTVQINGAINAPSPQPEALQRFRVLGRVDVSQSVADVVASLCFGIRRRDDVGFLADLTTSRTATSGMGTLHG